MTTELAKVDKYAILQFEPEEVADIMRQAAGPQGASFNDLERVTIPSGGATKWEIASLEHGTVEKEAIEGIIIGFQDSRVFWQQEMSGQTTPPDCASNDMITGIGNPGGECAVCPKSEFGSKSVGRGQACKTRRNLFIIEEDRVIPFVVQLPVTSMQFARKYMFRLAGRMIPFYAVVTRITLKKESNKAGQTYSIAQFSSAGMVDDDSRAKLKVLAAQLTPTLSRVPVGVTDNTGS